MSTSECPEGGSHAWKTTEVITRPNGKQVKFEECDKCGETKQSS